MDLAQDADTMKEPIRNKNILQSHTWLNLLSTEVLGLLPMRAAPIRECLLCALCDIHRSCGFYASGFKLSFVSVSMSLRVCFSFSFILQNL